MRNSDPVYRIFFLHTPCLDPISVCRCVAFAHRAISFLILLNDGTVYDVIFIVQLQCGADLTDSFVLAGLYFEIIFPLQYNTIVHLTHSTYFWTMRLVRWLRLLTRNMF